MTTTLALCNQKGGVGKSTTAYHLARAAVVAGLRVLVVDNDPQGNLTEVITAERLKEKDAGLADVLSGHGEDYPITDVIVAGLWDGLDVVPTTGMHLADVRNELVAAGAGREFRLRKALDAVAADYDLILIDCAPSLDQLTINGLVAADGAVVVTQSKLWSASGLALLLETVESVCKHYNPELTVDGIIVNQHESNTIGGAHWLDELTEQAQARGLRVLAPPVPKRVAIADATEESEALDQGTPERRELAELYGQHLSALTKKEN